MEMGFEQRFIEYAVKMTGSSNPERLISWMVDHQGMEVPEPEAPPRAPPTSQAAVTTNVEAAPTAVGGKSQRSSSTCSFVSDGIIYSEESSSDSSEFEPLEEEVEEPERKGMYTTVVLSVTTLYQGMFTTVVLSVITLYHHSPSSYSREEVQDTR